MVKRLISSFYDNKSRNQRLKPSNCNGFRYDSLKEVYIYFRVAKAIFRWRKIVHFLYTLYIEGIAEAQYFQWVQFNFSTFSTFDMSKNGKL